MLKKTIEFYTNNSRAKVKIDLEANWLKIKIHAKPLKDIMKHKQQEPIDTYPINPIDEPIKLWNSKTASNQST